MCFKVTLDRLYIAVHLTVDIYFDATEIEMFKIKRISSIRSVKCFIVNQSDNDSAGYLTSEKTFVYVVSHTRPYAIAFIHNTSDWILGITNLELLRLSNKHRRGNIRFTNQQLTFMYLDTKCWICSIGHQTKCILRTYETSNRDELDLAKEQFRHPQR